MVLLNLELKNYRRFRTQTLEFMENVIGLIGPNGAGKSTLIEAMAWALYGTRAARGAKGEIRSQGVEAAEPCEVRLEFELDGQQYRIERKLRGQSAAVEAAVFRSGRPEAVAVQEQGVNKFIERLLGLDYRSFFASVFARQKELSALGDMRPEDRRQAINRLINIDAIDRARDLARQRKNELAATLRGMETMLRDPAELEQEIRDTRSRVKSEKAAEKIAHQSHDEAAQKFAASKGELDRLTKLRDRFQKLAAEIGKTNTALEATRRQIREKLEELRKIDRSQQELKNLAPQREAYHKKKAQKEEQEKLKYKSQHLAKLREERDYQKVQFEEDEKIIERVEAELAASAGAQAELKKIDAEIDTKKKSLEKLRQDMRAKDSAIGAVTTQGKELSERLERINELGHESPCPVCERPLGTHFEQVQSHLTKEIESLRKKFRALREARTELEQKAAMTEDALEALRHQRENAGKQLALHESKREELKTVQKRHKKVGNKLQELEKEIAELGPVQFDPAAFDKLVAEFQQLQKIHEHALQLEALIKRKDEVEQQRQEAEARLREQMEKLAELEKSQAALQFEEKVYLSARETYEADLAVLEQRRETLTEARKALAVAQSQLQAAEKLLAETQEKLKQIKAAKEELLYLDALIAQFGDFRRHLAGRLRPLIAARASELLRLTTSGRYSLMELDEEYNIHIVDQGDTFPLQRFSGGEQDLANLCLRIAISQVVAERRGKAPIQFIVLDEIFGSQDVQRQNNILQALNQLQSQFRQIFIISHTESIKEILPVIISVEMTNGVESRATLM